MRRFIYLSAGVSYGPFDSRSEAKKAGDKIGIGSVYDLYNPPKFKVGDIVRTPTRHYTIQLDTSAGIGRINAQNTLGQVNMIDGGDVLVNFCGHFVRMLVEHVELVGNPVAQE